MKLHQLKLRNFRGFQTEVSLDFADLTALIGRNDAGKSTLMEAMDIFFNDGVPDKHDASKRGVAADVAIIATFSDLPERLVLDQTEVTSLSEEYLLNVDGKLEIHKIYNGALDRPKLTTLKLVAVHPSSDGLSDLVSLSNTELKARARERAIALGGVDQRANAQLRAAIRTSADELILVERDVSLLDGNGQNVWKGIQAQLPAFALFKSDRPSTDQDPEAQDPLNAAIKEAVRQKEAELNAIYQYIEVEVKKIADLTLKKLQEMDPTLAQTLIPSIPPPKWANLFKAAIIGDEGIPINKRGSGVRRLVLLNFFRAKAEQMMRENNRINAIYAVEEPETSQHPRNQRLLISALQELAGRDQVILTTHTPMLARALPQTSLRFVHVNHLGERRIANGGDDVTNGLIATSLGVLPDHNVKMFIGVEGKHDIPFLKNLSKVLRTCGHDVPDLAQLELDGEIIFTPLGGSALALWCNRLAGFNRPEFHIYDRDSRPPAVAKYQRFADEVNARNTCKAMITGKREMENYVHWRAINSAVAESGYEVSLIGPLDDHDNVPAILFQLLNGVAPEGDKWGDGRAKEFLANVAITKMDRAMLDDVDPAGEMLTWFAEMNLLLTTAVT